MRNRRHVADRGDLQAGGLEGAESRFTARTRTADFHFNRAHAVFHGGTGHLLTGIIIVAGVLASWTVARRDKEFFLLLSSTGLAYRRCELVRVNGTEMDVSFLKGKHARKRQGAAAPSTSAQGGQQ